MVKRTVTTDEGNSAARPPCAATTAFRFKARGRRPEEGSITGTVPDSPGFGTYEVNADCTGVVRFQAAPGVVIEERLVIVDNGREIRTAVMVPAAVMITGVHQRIHSR
jgi:hypothetical protein